MLLSAVILLTPVTIHIFTVVFSRNIKVQENSLWPDVMKSRLSKMSSWVSTSGNELWHENILSSVCQITLLHNTIQFSVHHPQYNTIVSSHSYMSIFWWSRTIMMLLMSVLQVAYWAMPIINCIQCWLGHDSDGFWSFLGQIDNTPNKFSINPSIFLKNKIYIKLLI